MALASKLLGLWVEERTVASSTPIFMQLLAPVAAIAVLAALASALFALVIVGLLWLIYNELLVSGISQQMTLFSMLVFILIVFGILVLYIHHYINRIKELSVHVMAGQRPVTGGLSLVAEAFVRGLLTSPFRR